MKTDWEAVERDYRLGVFSIREVAKQHGTKEGTIRSRAKAAGWKRDLTERVKVRARELLSRTSLTQGSRKGDGSEEDDAQLVEGGARIVENVVNLQRGDIQKLQELEQRLLSELGDEKNPPKKLWIGQFQGVVVKEEVNIPVTERSSALQALSSVQHKRIQLQRQAYNIDGNESGDDPLSQILKHVAEARRSLVREDD